MITLTITKSDNVKFITYFNFTADANAWLVEAKKQRDWDQNATVEITGTDWVATPIPR